VLALYLLGVVIYFLVSLAKSRQSGQPILPFALGMILSTLAVILIGGGLAGAALAISWYQVSFISACQGLPEPLAQNGVQNGPLALSVKLAGAASEVEQYAILSVSPQGELLATLSDQYRSQDPAWSPDGQKLAFVAQDWGTKQWGLYLVDNQGQASGQILAGDVEVKAPAWMPDGRSLLLQRWLETSNNPDTEIFSANLDGSDLRRLPGSEEFDGSPRPSPDGSQIAFVSSRDGQSDIYVMNADGSGVRRLTRNPAIDTDPDWSPDGQWIVFASNRGSRGGKNNYNLYIMAADGSNQCQLTRDEGSEWRPSWSPDGMWIAYVSLLESKAYWVRPDGTELISLPLTVEISDLLGLDWAPVSGP
jgi:Tol biopolymer transport system component